MKDYVGLLSDHLASYSTATEALTIWCRDRLPGSANAVSTRILADERMDPARYLGLLRFAKGEPLRHRRVVLLWGETVLSQAENWYLPDRLPAAARNRIRETSQPFGAVVRHHKPRRVLVSLSRPALSRESSSERLKLRRVINDKHVLLIHALLHLGEVTVSEVKERYMATLFGGDEANAVYC